MLSVCFVSSAFVAACSDFGTGFLSRWVRSRNAQGDSNREDRRGQAAPRILAFKYREPVTAAPASATTAGVGRASPLNSGANQPG